MTARGYSLAYSQPIAMGLVTIFVMLGVGMWMLYKGVGADQMLWYRLFFWVVWFAIVLFGGYRIISSARAIIVHAGDEIEFVGWLRRQRLTAQDIRSVRVTSGRQSQVVVLHAGGTIYLAGAINDFHQFLTELKQANPGVEFVGC